jgi:hypothetical protein
MTIERKAKPQRLKWTETPSGIACVVGNLRAEVNYPSEVRFYRNGVLVEKVKDFRSSWHVGRVSKMPSVEHGQRLAKRWFLEQQASATPPAWRPIETAPRDGDEILAWCPDIGIRVLHWFEGFWYLADAYDAEKYNPTHWLSLSALPAVPR